jgi:hypothetical protein
VRVLAASAVLECVLAAFAVHECLPAFAVLECAHAPFAVLVCSPALVELECVLARVHRAASVSSLE